MPVLEPEQMNQAFADAYNSGDIENLMALYEPDAVIDRIRQEFPAHHSGGDRRALGDMSQSNAVNRGSF